MLCTNTPNAAKFGRAPTKNVQDIGLGKCLLPGKVGQTSLNSGNKCPLARPLTVPNFIELGQTVYEKSVTIFYTLQYFGAPVGPSVSKFTNRPLYQVAKFSHILKTPVRDICCQSSSISSTAWPSDTQTKTVNDIVSAYHAATKKVKSQSLFHWSCRELLDQTA